MYSVALLYSPILLGGAVGLLLSGIVAVQCIIFFKLYPDEGRMKTSMIAAVWVLDIAHTVFILASLFYYFVAHFGHPSALARIPWLCKPALYISSGKNWWITAPIWPRSSFRAFNYSHRLRLRLGEWSAFTTPYTLRWSLFTSGLALSAGTDFIITLCLCHYLRKIRKLSTSSVMKGVMDTLTLYTLENGLITCLTTIAALVFWLKLPTTSIALSLNFLIGKLYPNSLLVLLNTRKELREMHSGDQGMHFVPTTPLATYYKHFPHRAPVNGPPPPPVMSLYEYSPAFKMHPPVEVQVQRTVKRNSAAISEVSFDSLQPPQRSLRPGSAMQWPALP
ncbi:hypothetical protein B0H15DRAFT_798922 [Mycena belliarum]|uniref:DUF6534 domain-containing protein n=1 Tax=Mycena belliarum TaxID=1033014 RepID=A0AAD6XUH3_9AGAR|nr:hypothetical protein B0H15DRAFT_798922 [Mycena belliae]